MYELCRAGATVTLARTLDPTLAWTEVVTEGFSAMHTRVQSVSHHYSIHLILTHRRSQGVPPASVAEWTLQGDGNRDFYDGKPRPSINVSLLLRVCISSVLGGWV